MVEKRGLSLALPNKVLFDRRVDMSCPYVKSSAYT
jgi:hypothetical protein